MVKSLVFVVALARGGCDQAPSTPAGGSGSAVIAATGSAGTKLGQTTLSPEARGQLDKLTGAPPNAPVKLGSDTPSAKVSAAKPSLAPKSAKRKNLYPGLGPERGAELMNTPDFESNKETWDYASVRKERGEGYYGTLYTAYRCDDRDGCKGAVGRGARWTAVGWHLYGPTRHLE